MIQRVLNDCFVKLEGVSLFCPHFSLDFSLDFTSMKKKKKKKKPLDLDELGEALPVCLFLFTYQNHRIVEVFFLV